MNQPNPDPQLAHRVNLLNYWTISVNRPLTQSLYDDLPEWGAIAECDSDLCLNFRGAFPEMSSRLKGALISLGADPQKPAEVYDVETLDDGSVIYGGWYHVVGEMLTGMDAMQPTNDHRWRLSLREIEDDVRVGVTRQHDAESGFPAPCLQVEFWVRLPWVLQ